MYYTKALEEIHRMSWYSIRKGIQKQANKTRHEIDIK